MNSVEKKTNKALAARIMLRMFQGWSLERIGQRTVWHMFGHLYTIRNGALVVKMSGGDQTFTAPATPCSAAVQEGPKL